MENINIELEISNPDSKKKAKIDMDPLFKQAASVKQPVPNYVDINLENYADINLLLFDRMREISNYTDEQVKELVLNSYMALLKLTTKTAENPYYSKGIMACMHPTNQGMRIEDAENSTCDNVALEWDEDTKQKLENSYNIN